MPVIMDHVQFLLGWWLISASYIVIQHTWQFGRDWGKTANV